ncbi:hypothetical protein H257_11384 [Aphanomyces astaci]|uniref:Uncharacterized protein n=1 Tax=Aphanomyces astaci TaxID=112090 RepID=W4G586_APHAT|nr:hypothetical protein H257_11384 [Aphanomyces astaci]ETV74073.1 hypothetical protein H257_11384 [Aphanomyces astaci]|eukprot:XP_009836586.1 hypothetical protein H257_11384 [Aphanomyces astaci]
MRTSSNDSHFAARCAPSALANNHVQAVASEAGLPETLEFKGMWDIVHLNEKWFNADKDRRKVYVVKGQSVRNRVCKSKRFIPKVMFLAAVARSDLITSVEFDGKIGMWPCVKYLPARATAPPELW